MARPVGYQIIFSEINNKRAVYKIVDCSLAGKEISNDFRQYAWGLINNAEQPDLIPSRKMQK
jgi:hypothetical protein